MIQFISFYDNAVISYSHRVRATATPARAFLGWRISWNRLVTKQKFKNQPNGLWSKSTFPSSHSWFKLLANPFLMIYKWGLLCCNIYVYTRLDPLLSNIYVCLLLVPIQTYMKFDISSQLFSLYSFLRTPDAVKHIFEDILKIDIDNISWVEV